MAKHHKRLVVALGVGIAVSAMAIASSAYITRTSSTGGEAIDNVQIVDGHKLPERWVINAAYGRGALSNLQAALAEIGNDNLEEAKKGAAMAQTLLAKIEPASPHSTATVEHYDESDVDADLILVHSEVRVLGDTDPGNSLQEELATIRHEFDMIEHEAIIAALGSLNIPLAYTRVDLPLTETVTLVNEVRQALEIQDSVRARAKLVEIGSRLRIETVHVGAKNSPAESMYEVDAG